MKKIRTVRWLKIMWGLQILFVFFSISSLTCLALSGYSGMETLRVPGNLLLYGWMFNPTGLIAAVIGAAVSRSESKDEACRSIIGRKRNWFFVCMVFDVLWYLTSVLLLVGITGGV